MNKVFIPPPQVSNHEPPNCHPAERSPYSDFEPFPLPPSPIEILNAPAVEFTEIGAKNLNEINGRKSAICDARSALPLDLVGGSRHRFAGARTAQGTRLAAAAIDAELGVGVRVISSDGVPAYLIPRRVRR